MKSNLWLTTLQALKLPFKLLVGLVRKRPKRTEREQKQRKHVRNFAPTHYSWQLDSKVSVNILKRKRMVKKRKLNK